MISSLLCRDFVHILSALICKSHVLFFFFLTVHHSYQKNKISFQVINEVNLNRKKKRKQEEKGTIGYI